MLLGVGFVNRYLFCRSLIYVNSFTFLAVTHRDVLEERANCSIVLSDGIDTISLIGSNSQHCSHFLHNIYSLVNVIILLEYMYI